MAWFWTSCAIVASIITTLWFRITLGWPFFARTVAWLTASLLVAASPCLVPFSALPYRLAAALMAIAILVKLYDIWRNPIIAKSLSPANYAVYLVNWFWLALPKAPATIATVVDRRQVAWAVPSALVMIGTCTLVFSIDYSQSPFLLEHSLKVVTLALTLIPLTDGAASFWRFAGGRALDPMYNLATSPTPAEFWRRWNRPAQQFFQVYVFDVVGGLRRPTIGILASFAVSGIVHEYVFGITLVLQRRVKATCTVSDLSAVCQFALVF